MSPESKKLLSQFATALSNETIYGESDTASMKRCREYGAKTEAARKVLEARIELLEGAAPVQTAPTDAQIIAALHANGIDTYPSKHGFDAVQVSATSVPNLRNVLVTLAAEQNRVAFSIGWDEREALSKQDWQQGYADALDLHELRGDMAVTTSAADAKDAEIGFYKRLSQQAQKEAMRESVRDAVAEALDGLYTCGRVWSAWSYGTMSQDDFAPAGEDDDVVDNITDAAIAAMAAAPSSAADKEGGDK